MLEYGLGTVTLDDLAPGAQGVIMQAGDADRALKRRLADMGLTPGTRVVLEGAAPLGDPLELTLRGYSLSLRREDARQILLSPPSQALSYPSYDPGEVAYDAALEQGAGRPRLSRGRLRIGLAGNPNSGKTTLFNALTGSNQYVGNWPGVTVEKVEGLARAGRRKVTIVDLPGIYSLSPYSAEELVARRYLVEEGPDVILNIVDATNLERNLYLTTQLLELGLPMVIALNFMDQVHRRGDLIDCGLLARHLGVPVVPIAARSGTNVRPLLEQAIRQAVQGAPLPGFLFPGDLGSLHRNIRRLIAPNARVSGLPPFWAASRLIEGDRPLAKALGLDGRAVREAERLVAEYEHTHRPGDRETFLADSRYRFIQWLTGLAVTRRHASRRPSVTRRVDAVVTHRVLAYPIFLLAMLGVFGVTFGPPGAFLSRQAEGLLYPLGQALRWRLEEWGAARWLVGLVADGMLRGVGSILTFLPQIALLFVFLSLLEDSGYMARAAYVMDGPLRRFGLSGKAFIPLLMGFGCTVPALLGVRTLEQEQHRRMTMMLVPFMSCSARLPVYSLMTAAFFPRHGGLVVFALYLFGILSAALSGILLRHTLFRGRPAPFVLELPPYRLPTLKNCALHVWERVSGFLYRAGTVILVMSVLLWALQSLGPGFQLADDPGQSVLGALGSLLAPVLAPLGFGSWQAAVALLSGLIAKEAVVSSMSLLYGFSPGDAGTAVALALSGTFPSPAAALSFLVFVLLYLPCMAALATLYREMNSLAWTLCSVVWQLAAAYGGAFLVYRLACLF